MQSMFELTSSNLFICLSIGKKKLVFLVLSLMLRTKDNLILIQLETDAVKKQKLVYSFWMFLKIIGLELQNL